ncbi:hypothetical protein UPYG_G00152650 [Umbra pygmaea]|uniref:Ig-like domain-containing protein n=1 Tax=Umbra pygmaea TaxID=75934 RepID=A0ABD0WXB7_UMBPY
MVTMETSAIILLGCITITHSSDPISFKQSVTGYRGEDITLDCKLLTGHLIQEKLVFADNSSLTINNLEINNTGTYTCMMTAFPGGSFERNITLSVQLDHGTLSSAMVFGIVTAVLLVIFTMTVIVYLIISKKRRGSLFNSIISIDPHGLVVNADRTRTGRDEDLVYSDIKIAKNRAYIPSREDQQHEKDEQEDIVTYAAVAVGNRRPVGEDIDYYKVVPKDQDVDDDWTI